MKLLQSFIICGVLSCIMCMEEDSLSKETAEKERMERNSYGGSKYKDGNKYQSYSRQYYEEPYSEEQYYEEDYRDNYYPPNPPPPIIDTCPFDCERSDSNEFIQSLAVPLFEYYNAGVLDHRYTIEYTGDVVDGGYKFVKQVCRVFRYTYADTQPIWYAYSTSATDSFLTNNFDELGTTGASSYVNRGIPFYMYTKPDWYTIPLYRYWCSANSDHLYTIDFNQFGANSNGCKLEGILGWCLPNLYNYGYMGPYQYGPPRPGYF